ncbi:MAG: DUF4926 domain-containing protein [Armatimonadetes bacterium]|nr:DUF4926 domain-containing protein [Armatimonadota bacterium]
MVREHDRVVLTADQQSEGLEAGDVGTVVHVYAGRNVYEVEFVTLSGATASIATLSADDIRAVTERDLVHVRELAPAAR